MKIEGLVNKNDENIEDFNLNLRENIARKHRFYFVGDFNKDGTAIFKADKKMGLVDKEGKVLFESFMIGEFHEGFAVAYFNGGLQCFIDTKGKKMFEPNKNTYGNFKEGRAWFHDENSYGFINKKGEFLAQHLLRAYDFNEGMAKVRLQDFSYGFVDLRGDLVIGGLDSVQDFKDGVAKVWKKKDNAIYYINKKGEFVFTENLEIPD